MQAILITRDQMKEEASSIVIAECAKEKDWT
jgi:hypothetical protein